MIGVILAIHVFRGNHTGHILVMGRKSSTEYGRIPTITNVRQNDVTSPEEIMLIQSCIEIAHCLDVVETLYRSVLGIVRWSRCDAEDRRDL